MRVRVAIVHYKGRRDSDPAPAALPRVWCSVRREGRRGAWARRSRGGVTAAAFRPRLRDWPSCVKLAQRISDGPIACETLPRMWQRRCKALASSVIGNGSARISVALSLSEMSQAILGSQSKNASARSRCRHQCVRRGGNSDRDDDGDATTRIGDRDHCVGRRSRDCRAVRSRSCHSGNFARSALSVGRG